ncbi:MAG: hypothetical protein CMG08_07905 [Candidatus Marinimicrobia bacterium]|nr:hypothetical protein [Candidatus Neomarinimicrobiota bacterium]MAV16702.1 hypothetical protein [Candidatus Neomarinimicrobiota bacterium]|tara:strand:+ start:327 stop:860 length:534 start_codon:yes stop_codon:yes gene_type:complete
MTGNFKTNIGMLIPAVSILAFFISIFYENYLFSLLFGIGGILLWFVYSFIMQSKMPDVTGNILILFGLLISIGYFLNYGISTNMFGGYDFNAESIIGSMMIIFFTVLLGSLYNKSYQDKNQKSPDVLLNNEPVKTAQRINESSNENNDEEAYEDYEEYYPEDYEEYYPEDYEEDYEE